MTTMGGRTYVDDNFGVWDIEDESDLDFYFQVQEESVWKRCQGCRQVVKIRPQYAFCNTCADKIERGYDVEY